MPKAALARPLPTRQTRQKGRLNFLYPAGLRWFNRLVERARAAHTVVETGRFGANMQVHLVNDGPVTFWLQTR